MGPNLNISAVGFYVFSFSAQIWPTGSVSWSSPWTFSLIISAFSSLPSLCSNTSCPVLCVWGCVCVSLRGLDWKLQLWSGLWSGTDSLMCKAQWHNTMICATNCWMAIIFPGVILILICLWFWCLQTATFSKSQHLKQQQWQKTLDTWLQSRAYPITLLIWLHERKHRSQASLSQFTQIWKGGQSTETLYTW